MKTYSNEEGAEMEELRFNSVFDIIGPVMIGPSSSHTAGAARIGKVVRSIFGQQPDSVDIYLYESFAKTYRGHGTFVFCHNFNIAKYFSHFLFCTRCTLFLLNNYR